MTLLWVNIESKKKKKKKKKKSDAKKNIKKQSVLRSPDIQRHFGKDWVQKYIYVICKVRNRATLSLLTQKPFLIVHGINCILFRREKFSLLNTSSKINCRKTVRQKIKHSSTYSLAPDLGTCKIDLIPRLLSPHPPLPYPLDSSSRKHTFIILTSLNPLLYSETGLYRGVHYLSYFCLKRRLWYSLEPPQWGGSNVYPHYMFWAEIRKNIRFFI